MTYLQMVLLICSSYSSGGYREPKDVFKACVEYFNSCPRVEWETTDDKRILLCIKEWE